MIIHRIFNFCKKVVKHFFKLEKREVEFKKWIETTKNDEMYIILGGFGDAVWFMTFWEQYKKKQNLKSYKILTEPKYAEIFYLYGEKNLILDKVDFLWLLLKKTVVVKPKIYDNIHIMIFPHAQSKMEVKTIENYRSRIGIMMDDYFRFGCFDLSYEDDSPVNLPILAETHCQIDSNKNILLVPYTKSRINMPTEYWERIASVLKERGYTVYTNVGTSKEKAVDGTVPLNIRIAELPAVLKKYGFISLCARCGLADWLFVNECKQIVIHSYLKNPKTRNELLCSNVERKDSFKIMKRKIRLNENNAEDLYFCIDDMPNDYANKVVEIVSKLERFK